MSAMFTRTVVCAVSLRGVPLSTANTVTSYCRIEVMSGSKMAALDTDITPDLNNPVCYIFDKFQLVAVLTMTIHYNDDDY